MGLATSHHMGSPQTRNRTHVPYIGRQSLNHWTTREVSTIVFREWFPLVGHMHKGWVDSGTKESGVQTRSPQGLWTRGQTEGEGLSQSRNRWPVTLTCRSKRNKFEDDPWSETLPHASSPTLMRNIILRSDDTQTFRMYMSLPSLTTMKRELSL